jgi:hypothetical protein
MMDEARVIAWIGLLIWTAALALLYYGYIWTSLAVSLVSGCFALWSIAISKGWIKS